MAKIAGSQEHHTYCLDQLVRHLGHIDEDPFHVSWIMHEGIYMPDNTCRKNSLCDLVIAYHDKSITLAELKSNRNKKGKATKQLEAGALFVRDQLPQYTVKAKKFVWYVGGERPYRYISV